MRQIDQAGKDLRDAANGQKYLELVVARLAHFLEEFARGEPIAATFAYLPQSPGSAASRQ